MRGREFYHQGTAWAEDGRADSGIYIELRMDATMKEEVRKVWNRRVGLTLKGWFSVPTNLLGLHLEGTGSPAFSPTSSCGFTACLLFRFDLDQIRDTSLWVSSLRPWTRPRLRARLL